MKIPDIRRTIIRWLLTALMTGASIHAISQTITGSIKGSDGKPLTNASVRLMNHADSGRYRMCVSDSLGNFVFVNVARGSYQLEVSMIGYQTYNSSAFSMVENVKLPVIYLELKSNELSEIKVQARMPAAGYRDGKLVVNIASNISLAGSNGAELLERLPGISVDSDGNILLNGRTGVRVLINNSPVNLSGPQLISLLQSKTAHQLDRIEIITNPSAQFDASGSGGIINIVLKKQRSETLFNSFSSTISRGSYFKGNMAGSIGFRKNKWNLFLSTALTRNKDYARPHINRTQPNKDFRFFHQRSDQTIVNKTLSLNSSVDYNITARTVAAVSGSLSWNLFSNYNKSHSSFSDITHKTVSYSDFGGSTQNDNRNVEINLSLKHDFDTSGRKIYADAGLFWFRQVSDQFSETISHAAGNMPVIDTFILSGNLPSTYHIRSLRLDYTHPFSGYFKAELGLKATSVNNDGAAHYFKHFDNRIITDSSRSNHFLYQERIQAIYVNGNYAKARWNLQIGVRAEQTFLKGNQLTTSERFSNSYLQLFPSVFISHTTKKRLSFGLSAGRRIDRPDYQDLNPFKFFVDLFTYRQGNDKLLPHYAHNLELNVSRPGAFLFSVFYSHTRANITRVFVRSDDTAGKAAYQTTMNLGSRKNYGISVSLPLKFTNWWSGNVNLQLFANKYQGNIQLSAFDQQMNSYIVNTTQSFAISPGFNAEIALIFRSPYLSGTFRNKSMYNVSSALSKAISNKLSARLVVNDIFHQWKRRFVVSYGDMDMQYSRPNDTRFIRLVFTYSLNKTMALRQRSPNTNEERSRATGSDN